jgi:hypothetical protein
MTCGFKKLKTYLTDHSRSDFVAGKDLQLISQRNRSFNSKHFAESIITREKKKEV